jgi:myo-inositol-1(or 4)-monophosphatase
VDNADLTLALEIARDAGALLLDSFGKAAIYHKGESDLVTDADRASEAMIVKRLAAARPGDAVVAEEGARVAGGPRVWYVDPLDGTNNFAHNFWAFAVSIGLAIDGAAVVGVVHAPALQQTFTAFRGGGALLNGSPIAVSGIATLADALVATGFPYARRTLARNNLAEHNRVLMAVQATRRVGVASLDLCWTAAGRWDGYWEQHLSPWDIAAGVVVCQEAGAIVTNFAGGPVDLERPELVAANPLIHADLLKVLNAE